MEALQLLLFILPGFFSLLSAITQTKKIKRIGADYWIFLSMVCLISAGSIYLSGILFQITKSLLFYLGNHVSWISVCYEWLRDDLFPFLKLSEIIVFKYSLAIYLFSFVVARIIITFKCFDKYLSYIDGTEAIDNFLEELILQNKNNTAIVTLDSGKVFIGPIIDGDFHKDIKNDSITIRPFMSGYKKDGKLVIATTNISVAMSDQGLVTLNPNYEDLKNNIQLSKVSYISKFVLIAFSKYISDGQIIWEDKESLGVKEFFIYINTFHKSLEISKDK